MSLNGKGISVLLGLQVIALGVLVSGCEPERPRTYSEYLEDSVGREATLMRCNTNREATRLDAECVNARRAAQTLAAQEEADRRSKFEAESNRKRAALRERIAAQRAAQQRAAIAAREAEEAAYEARWVYPGGAKQPGEAEMSGGAPMTPGSGGAFGSGFETQSIPPGISQPSDTAPVETAPHPGVAGSALPSPDPSTQSTGVSSTEFVAQPAGGATPADQFGAPSPMPAGENDAPAFVQPNQPAMEPSASGQVGESSVPVAPAEAGPGPVAPEEVTDEPIPAWQPFEPPPASDGDSP